VTFELATLALATTYDPPIRSVAVPGAITPEHGLAMLDGARPDIDGLARVTHDTALISLVVPTGADLLVTLEIGADWTSFVHWRRVQDDGPGDDRGRHRCVAVSVGGELRAVVVLARRPQDGRLLQRVTVPVAAEQISAAGRVLIALEEPAGLPLWARKDQLPDPLIGLLLTSINVAPATDEAGGRLSSGRPRRRRPLLVPAAPGLLVINPGGSCRLRIWPEEEVAAVEVEMLSATGTALGTRQANRASDGGFAVALPALAEPAYARVLDGGRPIAWRAGLRPVGPDSQG
jgi:hypothetical protein